MLFTTLSVREGSGEGPCCVWRQVLSIVGPKFSSLDRAGDTLAASSLTDHQRLVLVVVLGLA